MKAIDLNCDMGEIPEDIANGTQESLMRSVTPANIACGGHAGDAASMRATIQQALKHNVAVESQALQQTSTGKPEHLARL